MNRYFRITCIYAISLLLATALQAQKNFTDPTLAISLIPDSLLKNAYAVIRAQHTTVELKSIDKQIVHVEQTISVLHKKAEQYLDFVEGYKSGSSKIKNVKIHYYDEQGVLLREVKTEDLTDVGSSSSASYISDYRNMYFDFEAVKFPVTIKMKYQKEDNNTMNIEPWVPIWDYNLSCEVSTFKVINTAQIPTEFKELNLDKFAITKESDGYTMSQALALNSEKYAPGFYNIFPFVMGRCKDFTFEGKRGNFNNWNEFGQWIFDSFLSDKDDLNKVEILH